MIVIAFFIINELSVWNGEVFEGNYCSTTMYLQPKQSDEVMRKDIETAPRLPSKYYGISVVLSMDTFAKYNFKP